MKKIFKTIFRKSKYLEILAYFFQNRIQVNFSGEGEFGSSLEDHYSHTIDRAKLYFEKYDGDLSNKIILEIGTGLTRAQMLYMIKEYNLKKVYCYDRFKCLSDKDKKIIEKYKLNSYLASLEYITGTNDEIGKNIKKDSVDYIVSNAVLEHVDDLDLLFKNLKKVLSPEGKMYHKIDLRCHNKFKKYGELYFHSFSDAMWHEMGGNIGHPNRKLVEDYVDLFQRFGLRFELNSIEEFSNIELKKAKEYLKTDSIEKYKMAVVEFFLYKK